MKLTKEKAIKATMARWNNFTLITIKVDARKAIVKGRIHGKEFNLSEVGENNKDAFEKVMSTLVKTIHLVNL